MRLSLVPLPLLPFCIGIIIVASSATSTNANTANAATSADEHHHHHQEKRRSSLRSGNGSGGSSSLISTTRSNNRSLAYDLTGFKKEKLDEVRPSVSESESEEGGDDDTDGETPTEADDNDDNDDGIDADANDSDIADTDVETTSTESNDTDDTTQQDGGVGAEGMLVLTFDPPIAFRQFASNTCDPSTLLDTGNIYGITKLDEGIFCSTDDLNSGERYTKHTVQDCSADRGGVIEVYQDCTDNTCTNCDEVTDSSDDDSAKSVYTSFTKWAEIFPTEFQDHCFQQLFTLNNSDNTSSDSLFDDDDSNTIDMDFQFDTESTDNALKHHDFVIDNSCMKEYQPTPAPAGSETDVPTLEPITEAPSEEEGGDDDTDGETPTETDDNDDNDADADADADGETSSTESNKTDETTQQDGGVGSEGVLLLTFDPPIVFRQFSSNTCEASTLLYTGKIYGISKLDEGIFCFTDDLDGGEKYTKHTVQDCNADRGGIIEVYQTCTDNTCTDCDEVTDTDEDDSAEPVYTSFTEWAEVFPTEFQDHCFQQLFTLNNSNNTSGDSLFDDDGSNTIDVDFQFDTESTDNALKFHDFIIDNSCMKEYQPTAAPAGSETDVPTPSDTDAPTPLSTTEAPSAPPTPESTDTSFVPTGTDAPTEEPTDVPTDEPTATGTTKNDNCEAGTPLEFYVPVHTEYGVKLSICFEETLLASYDLPLAHDGPVILNSEDGVYDGVLFTSDPIPVDDNDDTNTQNTTIISFYNFTSQDTTNLELTESIPMASGAVLLEDGTVAILSQGNVTDNGGIYTWNPSDGAVTALTTSWGRPPIQEEEEEETTPFNSPNALVQSQKDGALWFTDPQYGYDFGFRPEPQAGNWVWRYDPVTNTSRKMADGFDRPTGLAFSPNEEFLYVADNQQLPPLNPPSSPPSPQVWSSTIYRYRVDEYFATQEPLLTDRTVFAVSSQGLLNVGIKVDSFGNVWRASDKGIEIYYPTGVVLGFIPIDRVGDGDGVTNFALQEKDDTYILYVMNQTRLLKLVGTIQDFSFVGN